jgi:predicted phospho-2-dehydro-3-deoxyheptonate aldolase
MFLKVMKMKNLMERILDGGKAVIIPMDHGVTEGPIEGLADMNAMVKEVSEYATAVLLHKGIIKSLNFKPRCGLILHGSASTKLSSEPDYKVQVATPAEAIKLGCQAFSMHINIGGSSHEQEMLSALGAAAEECDGLGLPLLAMVYPRGKNITNVTPESIALVARAGAELGADIVKCPYSGDVESFRRVVRGCPVPVVIAGGAKSNSDMDVLDMVAGAMEAGAAGVSLGRNAFQHKDPRNMVRAIREIVIENRSMKDALEILGQKVVA